MEDSSTRLGAGFCATGCVLAGTDAPCTGLIFVPEARERCCKSWTPRKTPTTIRRRHGHIGANLEEPAQPHRQRRKAVGRIQRQRIGVSLHATERGSGAGRGRAAGNAARQRPPLHHGQPPARRFVPAASASTPPESAVSATISQGLAPHPHGPGLAHPASRQLHNVRSRSAMFELTACHDVPPRRNACHPRGHRRRVLQLLAQHVVRPMQPAIDGCRWHSPSPRPRPHNFAPANRTTTTTRDNVPAGKAPPSRGPPMSWRRRYLRWDRSPPAAKRLRLPPGLLSIISG